MYGVGDVPPRARRLVDVTYEGWMRGLAQVKPGARLGDIGHAIQSYVEAHALQRGARLLRPRRWPRVPRRAQHPALRPPGAGPVLKPDVLHHRADGEPRQAQVKLLADGWTAVTRDKSLSAQCEHSPTTPA
jgi:methionyl aminopeptidase